MNLRFLVLIRGMREEGDLKIFSCYPKDCELPVSYFASDVAYLGHVECLYLIMPMVVGFC